MMFRGRIAGVSYLNTVPFIYGLEHAGCLRAEFLLSPPSSNITAFRDGLAQVALVPSAALFTVLDDPKPITSFCIGADGAVRTVMIMSTVPATQIRRIWLDSHSWTSVMLTRVLCAEYWRITPRWQELSDYSIVQAPEPGDAFLLIGDKVFDHEGLFPYNYDLAACWKDMTGLPFVFATWIAAPGVDGETIDALQKSLEYGVAHIPEAVAESTYADRPYAVDYLKYNIDFCFDGPKQKALSLFRDKVRRFVPGATPG